MVKITKSWGKVEHKNFVKTFYPLFLSLRNSNKLTSVCCLSLFTVHKVSSKDKNSKPSKDEKVKVDKKKSEEDEKKNIPKRSSFFLGGESDEENDAEEDEDDETHIRRKTFS